MIHPITESDVIILPDKSVRQLFIAVNILAAKLQNALFGEHGISVSTKTVSGDEEKFKHVADDFPATFLKQFYWPMRTKF